jgi:hypothetical protein
MLPFIQCHHTRGLALSGGVMKPASRAEPELLVGVWQLNASKIIAAITIVETFQFRVLLGVCFKFIISFLD